MRRLDTAPLPPSSLPACRARPGSGGTPCSCSFEADTASSRTDASRPPSSSPDRYDTTGRTDERSFLEEGAAAGWEAYFAETFEQVTRSKLDEIKAAYQGTPNRRPELYTCHAVRRTDGLSVPVTTTGSDEEKADVLAAYRTHEGSLPDMLDDVMCAAAADEGRFKTLVEEAIATGELERTATWTTSAADGKAAKKRAAAERKEAREAEEHAKEIGVWDEFYGSGKATESKKTKGKGKATVRRRPLATPVAFLCACRSDARSCRELGPRLQASAADDEDADLAGLRALILKRGSDRASNTIANIEARARAAASTKKGKKEKQFAPPAVRPLESLREGLPFSTR